ncbi:hypothetical protein KBD45_02085 [Candidatus Dojkabacteria bacterium]|nr:hypothetical protein [Candidatus Dojkabacteria bacterium]
MLKVRFWLLFSKGKDMLTGEQSNILKTSFLLMAVILVTKLSGMLFNAVVAHKLGADRPLDLFLLANTIPEMFGNLLLVGIVSAVLIPVLIKDLNQNGFESFIKLFNSLLNGALILFIVMSAVIILTADSFFPFLLNTVIKPNQAFTPEELTSAIWMMRTLLFPQLILGISTFYSSGLNIFNRFMLPQLAPFFYNVGRIVGAIILVPYFGVEGLVWGTLFGALLHLLIQLPLALKLGLRNIFILDFTNPNFITALKVGLPRIIGLGAEYMATAIDKFIAGRFVVGSVVAYTYAVSLITIPLSLFGLTFSVAAFPTLSKYYHSGDYKKFSDLIIQLINNILFLAVPATVVILILRVSLVRLFFGIFGGEFDFQDTYLTAWVVGFFGAGLIFESMRSLLYRVFYAANDTIRPTYTAIFTVVLGMLTGIAFTNYFSHFDQFEFSALSWNPVYFTYSENGKAAIGGLALSSSIVFTLEFFILLYLVNKRIVKLNFKKLKVDLFNKIGAGIVMALMMFSFFKLWGNSEYQTKTLYLVILVVTTVLVGLIGYFWTCYVLKIPEFEAVKKILKKLNAHKILDYT